MSSKKLLAMDLGASGGKCFVGLFKKDSFQMHEVHRFEHAAMAFFLPEAHGVISERTYWNDHHIYHNLLEGLRNAGRQVGGQLDGLAIDVWGADGHLVSHHGDVMGKVYAYRDHRLDQIREAVCERISEAKLYEITGLRLNSFNISNQLFWLVHERPELIAQARWYLPMPSLLYYYLGGCTQVDSTFASVTQLMEAAGQSWSPTILDALRIPRRLLPEIVAPGTRIGKLHTQIAHDCNIAPCDLLAIGSHDTACAFAAAPVQDPKTALIISSGTWSLVGKLLEAPVTTPQAMDLGFSNEGGIGNTRFLRNCMGMWIVQELLREWKKRDGQSMGWAEVDALTPTAAPFAVLFDPDDVRLYNPDSMEAVLHEMITESGQRVPRERAGLLRAIFESLALKYRYVNEKINLVTGGSTTVVHIVGGGSNNALLNQFTANALGVPVLAGPGEATAIGNLMVQALGAKIIPNQQVAMELINNSFPVAIFLPQQTTVWNTAYDRFLQLIK